MDKRLLELIDKYVQTSEGMSEQIVDSNLSDLGLDSFAIISLILDIEEAYSIKFPEELLSLEKLSTAKEFEYIIQELQNKAG
ncbi:phosphopantetheine-binding protein [Paenibacillus periandrae]|uniref:phosphopantetheine-binding protein n=1 Tax=Paenibacillus periandrae TaxID=1761741 RepID=UPI001F09134F|nr:phosphopantetheine-binding protein [Paenibacillus periandrae]